MELRNLHYWNIVTNSNFCIPNPHFECEKSPNFYLTTKDYLRGLTFWFMHSSLNKYLGNIEIRVLKWKKKEFANLMQNFIANKLGSSIFVRTPTEAFIGFNFDALPTFAVTYFLMRFQYLSLQFLIKFTTTCIWDHLGVLS